MDKDEKVSAALLIDSVSSVSVLNITIQDSKGYVILAVNMMGMSVIESSVFSANNIQTEQYNAVGGNALTFYSNNHPYNISGTMYFTIKNSYFMDGTDNSQAKCLYS